MQLFRLFKTLSTNMTCSNNPITKSLKPLHETSSFSADNLRLQNFSETSLIEKLALIFSDMDLANFFVFPALPSVDRNCSQD